MGAPYADALYFGLLIYLLVPATSLGLVGRLSKGWVVGATALMIVIQYWGREAVWAGLAVPELWMLVTFGVVQWSIAAGYVATARVSRGGMRFYAAITGALLPLVVAKLTGAFGAGTGIGFLGISYVTFRSLDVIFSVRDGLVKSLSTPSYFAYVFFFPTISAGPIDRYRRFVADYERRRTGDEFLQDLDRAVHRFFEGLLYKFILAALVKQFWMDRVADETGLVATISYMYAYSAYLFFDFAGYSAFAIALSDVFGIHTPENFRRPFLAGDIAEFWTRWHISLSSWFRDHVYMRFVMAAMRGRWFHSKQTASYAGFLVTFGLMGLWHGLAPRYIIYGLYHAALLTMHSMLVDWRKRHGLPVSARTWSAIGWFVTFHAVCFGFLIFSGRLG